MKSFSTTVDATLDAVEPRVRDALAAEGFGVLTEIDVAATLRAKLGVERAPLKILGACNPNFAHRALELDPTVSLLLPCNVVLEAVDGATTVSVVDPRALIDEEEFRPLADEAADRLRRVVDVVGQR
jgi:uncharacterized protein (DUF302 family)